MMKRMHMVIFFAIVIIIYFSVNYYIFIRGSQALPEIPWLKITYYIVFCILLLSYIIASFLVRAYPSKLAVILECIGSVWMGAMLYFFLIIVFWDLLRLINHFIPFFPVFITNNYEKAKLYIAAFSVLVVTVVLIAGYINASNPRLKELNIEINKKVDWRGSFNIVSVSDIHIGGIIGKETVSRLVEKINGLNPDLVIFPGDILDQDLATVLTFKIGGPLKNISAKYGVYAITGNHEYIGGIEKSSRYLKSLGIILLRDSVALIDNTLYLIGREDRDCRRFNGFQRKSLNELMKNVDKTKPVILLDHQPFNLEEAEKNDIDLQISGHTHHGQLWPFNYITNMVYELSWGYKRKGNTQFYVSSGYGTWGPPVRTGNKPEIVLFRVNFKD